MLKTALSFGLLVLVACSSDEVASPGGSADPSASSATASSGPLTPPPSNGEPRSNPAPQSSGPTDSVTLTAPNDIFVRVGSSASFDVETNGTAAIEDLPAGVVATVSGTKVSISADASAGQGDFMFTVRASSGTATQTLRRSMTVGDKPGARDKSYSGETLSFAVSGNAFGRDGQSYFVGTDVFQSRVTRVTSDGKVDKSFGMGGSAVFVPVGYALAIGTSVAMFPNGDVLVGSIAAKGFNANTAFAGCVTRLDANGDVVTSFGTSGSFCIERPADVIVRSVHVLPDGKVLVSAGVDLQSLLAVRLTETGTPDITYGKQGYRPILRVGGASLVKSEVDASGRLVLASNVPIDGVLTGCVYRVTVDGELDSTFNAKGTPGSALVSAAMVPIGINALALHPDGAIYVGGALGTTAALASLDQDGLPRGSFGTGGWMTYEANTKVVAHLSVVGDKLLAVGLLKSGGVFLARTTGDGALDESFGTGGIAPAGDTALTFTPPLVARGRIAFSLYVDSGKSEMVRFWE